jgi:hypothetical protein
MWETIDYNFFPSCSQADVYPPLLNFVHLCAPAIHQAFPISPCRTPQPAEPHCPAVCLTVSEVALRAGIKWFSTSELNWRAVFLSSEELHFVGHFGDYCLVGYDLVHIGSHYWRRIWGFHGGDYEECRLLGCGAVWVYYNMEATCSSETSVYKTHTAPRRHIPRRRRCSRARYLSLSGMKVTCWGREWRRHVPARRR